MSRRRTQTLAPYPTKRPPRPRNREAPGLHGSEAAVLLASWEPLHAVAATLHHWQPGDPGPHPDVPPAVLVLFGIMAWNERGQRGAARLLRSAVVWEPIRATMAARYPGYPGLQQGAAPVSRSEFWRYCETYGLGEEVFAALLEEFEQQAASLARSMGMFDPKAGTVTHPARQNTFVGDGTVLRPRFDAVLGDRQTNEATGELEQKPYDPDADFFKTGDGAHVVLGTKFGFVESRLPHVNERTILSFFNVPAGKGNSEADQAVRAIARAKSRLPAAQAYAWDMALRGKHIDALYPYGLQPVVKTARAPGGHLRERLIGVHEARLRDGTKREVEIFGLDGAVSVRVIAQGAEQLVPCKRRQTRPRSNASGAIRWYVDVVIPDDPRVAPDLRGADVRVRLDTSDEDRARGLNRAENVRAIHEGDDDWNELHGLRPGSESTNRWFKERLRDTRAPAVGVPRQRLHLLFGCLFNNFRAWLANSARAGISGQGLPPPPAVAA